VYFYKIIIISCTLIILIPLSRIIKIVKTITTKDCLKLKVMHSL
ncbi:unnamed protein product, partial [Arabidopsis halleri]